MCCVEKEIIEQLCVWVSVGLYMYVLLDQQVHVCLLLFFFFLEFPFLLQLLSSFLFVCLFVLLCSISLLLSIIERNWRL